jgi:putative addiction module killer protein
MISIKVYSTEHGVEPYKDFFSSINDPRAKSMVAKAINKMEKGLGDYKTVGGGVHENRIHVGKGYRIYFYNDGQELVILLGGSDKKNQAREIENAKSYLRDYKRQKRSKSKGEKR